MTAVASTFHLPCRFDHPFFAAGLVFLIGWYVRQLFSEPVAPIVRPRPAALILALQLAATPRMLRFLGMRAALSLQPGVCLAGLALIARHPSPAVVAAAEVVRKVTGYAISRPARELLFTVVSREEKYKGKLVVDTVVQRAGDTLAAGAFQVIENTWHAGPQGVAVAGCTVCLGWLAVVSALGRRFTALSAAVAAGAAAASQ